MDVHLRKRIGGQDDLVATWQLVRTGWSEDAIRHWAKKECWRSVHDGVWALSQAPLTQRQLWRAATLTAPRTFLMGDSGCACHGFIERPDPPFETVVRAGSGGKRRYPGLLVARSTTLAGQTGELDGLPILSPERCLVDVAPRLSDLQLGRGFREACRLKCTTANDIARQLNGQRGTAPLVRQICQRPLSPLPLGR